MRIRNTAMLAAALAVSGVSSAQAPVNLRQRHQTEDALAEHAPSMHKHVDPAEQDAFRDLDYTQEGRLNERQRAERRQKQRDAKQRIRSED